MLQKLGDELDASKQGSTADSVTQELHNANAPIHPGPKQIPQSVESHEIIEPKKFFFGRSVLVVSQTNWRFGINNKNLSKLAAHVKNSEKMTKEYINKIGSKFGAELIVWLMKNKLEVSPGSGNQSLANDVKNYHIEVSGVPKVYGDLTGNTFETVKLQCYISTNYTNIKAKVDMKIVGADNRKLVHFLEKRVPSLINEEFGKLKKTNPSDT